MALALAILPLLAGIASAARYPDLLPGVYGTDSGAEAFKPGNQVIAVKLDDSLASFGASTTFGFYFTATPSVLIPIWDGADRVVGSSFPVAVIDFTTGLVLDFQHSNVQSTFTGTGRIGFYETINLGVGAPFTFYTTAAQNFFGADLAGTFPLLTDPTNTLISFDIPGTPVQVISAFVVTNVHAVPEPAPFALLLAATSLLGLVRRRPAACARA